MVLTAPTFTFHFPPDFDERAEFEMPSKGYLAGGIVETPDGKYPVTFFDPVRLAQDLELTGEHGFAVVAEPGLIVIPEVTRDAIAGTIEELIRQRFFCTNSASREPEKASGAAEPGPTHCVFCRTDSPSSTFCPACGKAKRKWCPTCADWKAASFTDREVDDAGGISILIAEYEREATFCPDCGTELQAKRAPRQ